MLAAFQGFTTPFDGKKTRQDVKFISTHLLYDQGLPGRSQEVA